MALLAQSANPAGQQVPQQTDGTGGGAARPFTHYARRHTEQGPINQSGVAFGTLFAPTDIPAIGFLRGIWLNVVASGGVGSVTPAIYAADAPWSVINNIEILDIGGQAIVQVDGYGLYLINRFGGYQFNPITEHYPSFSLVNAASNKTGNFSFTLFIPFEMNKLSGYGCLPNENAAAAYKFRLLLNAASSVYSQSPGTLPTLAINTQISVWTKPTQQGAPTAPPGLGSTAYWTQQIYNTVSGANDVQLTGRKGNYIHSLLFVWRNSSAARYDVTGGSYPTAPAAGGTLSGGIGTNLTDFRFRVNSYDQIGPSPYAMFLDQVQADFSFGGQFAPYGDTTSADSVPLIPQGVLPLSYRNDFSGHPAGDDTMELYLPTSGATKLEVLGTLPSGGSGGSLYVYTGDLIPQGDIPYAVA